MRQHRLPDRYTQPSKEKEAAGAFRITIGEKKRDGLTRTVSTSRSPRFRQTSKADPSPRRPFRRERTTHQLLLAQPVLQQRVSQITGAKEHDRRREPDLKAVDVKPVHGELEAEQDVVDDADQHRRRNAIFRLAMSSHTPKREKEKMRTVGKHVRHHGYLVMQRRARPQEAMDLVPDRALSPPVHDRVEQEPERT